MSGTSHTFQDDRQVEWSSSHSREDDSVDHDLNIRKGKIKGAHIPIFLSRRATTVRGLLDCRERLSRPLVAVSSTAESGRPVGQKRCFADVQGDRCE